MSHKKVKTSKEAWDIQETYEGKPHGWIQWKGTSVCMDFKCPCGKFLHFDEEFLYHLKCGHCGKMFMLNGHVEAIEIEEEPTGGVCVGYDED